MYHVYNYINVTFRISYGTQSPRVRRYHVWSYRIGKRNSSEWNVVCNTQELGNEELSAPIEFGRSKSLLFLDSSQSNADYPSLYETRSQTSQEGGEEPADQKKIPTDHLRRFRNPSPSCRAARQLAREDPAIATASRPSKLVTQQRWNRDVITVLVFPKILFDPPIDVLSIF